MPQQLHSTDAEALKFCALERGNREHQMRWPGNRRLLREHRLGVTRLDGITDEAAFENVARGKQCFGVVDKCRVRKQLGPPLGDLEKPRHVVWPTYHDS